LKGFQTACISDDDDDDDDNDDDDDDDDDDAWCPHNDANIYCNSI